MKTVVAIVPLLLLAVLVGEMSAQATRAAAPAETRWAQGVAEILIEGDPSGMIPVLGERCAIRLFNRDEPMEVSRLVEATAHTRLIGAHVYPKLPASLASDIASDFGAAEGVPDEIRERMTPQGEAALRRANLTAAQWLAKSLGVDAEDSVAVLIFWVEPAEDSHLLPSPARKPEALFVLAKLDAAGDSLRMTRIVYGNPAAE